MHTPCLEKGKDFEKSYLLTCSKDTWSGGHLCESHVKLTWNTPGHQREIPKSFCSCSGLFLNALCRTPLQIIQWKNSLEQIIAGAGREGMALQGEEVSSPFFLHSATAPHSNLCLPTDLCRPTPLPSALSSHNRQCLNCSTKEPVKTTGQFTDSSQPS